MLQRQYYYVLVLLITLMGSSAYGASPTDITFNTAIPISITIPGSFTIMGQGDIDKDGHLDVILGNYTRWAILFGHGDGTFTTVEYPGPYSSTSPVVWANVNDFNKDGLNDIAFNGNGPNYVYLATGPRTFAEPGIYTAGVAPTCLTSGDFNRDGYPDIAIANGNSSSVNILFNDKTGLFGNMIGYSISQYPSQVMAVDLRKNGIDDIITSSAYNTLSTVFTGTGTGPFNYRCDISTGGGHLVSDDFNNDGNIDVAGSDYWGAHIGVALNNGDASFPVQYSYNVAEYPANIKCGDLNGDGYSDLTVGHQVYSDAFAIYLNDGTGAMVGPQIVRTPGVGGNTAIIGDFNEDGKPDVLVDGWDYHLSLFINTTIPLIATATVTPTSPNGQNGWYTVPVQITLNASSPNYTADQLTLNYQINGGVYNTYSSPLSFSTDGTKRLTYWVQSPTGTTSVPHNIRIQIDQTSPTSTATLNGTLNGSYYIGDVSFSLAATDTTGGSGIAVTHYTIDGGSVQNYTSAFKVAGSGSHTVTYWSVDNAGNTETTHSVSFTINSDPSITSLSPSTVSGAKTFTLTVNGTNFVSGSIIKFNGTNMTTTYVSATQLTASINKYYTTLSSYPGSATISVLNPDGGRSTGATLTITAPVMPPTITSLSPDSITGATTFTLTVNGTDFQYGAVIKWNGTNMPTTFVSSTQLTATINKYYDTLASYPGSATISVLNPDSGRSAGATLTITAL